MNCIVLGGAGFLGEHLGKKLLEAGHEVIVYDRESNNLEQLIKKYPLIRYISGDFSTEDNYSNILDNVHCVFHLISTTVPSNLDTVWDVNSNVIPTLRLLEACRKKENLKFIFYSSGGTVYGKPKVIPILESHDTNPVCSYGIQKLMIEKYLQFYGEFYGLDYYIMRIANPYGEGQTPFGSQGVIAAFLARALSKQPLEIWGDSSIIRDFIYVDDVMNASLSLLTYQGKEKIFNIASNIGISLNDIIDEIKRVVDHKIIVEQRAGRKQDVPINILNNIKAKQELNWQPQVSLQEGIGRMRISWDYRLKKFLI